MKEPVLFGGFDPEEGCELWLSPGTPESTVRAAMLQPGMFSGQPGNPLRLGDALSLLGNGPAGHTLFRLPLTPEPE